ncbi:MAG: insulinase family protein [Proteobacteria bacterium]|nr:insulinase family protein [Pseudomonadota bacterium]
MIRRVSFLLVFLAWAATAHASDKVYNAQHATLDNGMQVIVIPVHRTPAVTHMVWYMAGAAEEPQGISGTAHFLEHLLFKGTPRVPAGKFSEIVQRMGGNDNAFTSWDYTAFFQTVPKEKLADVMAMEAERMNDLTPKLSDVYSEKQVVMEERRQNIESDPGALLGERMRQALFPNHPYGRPIIGWMPEMQGLTWVDSLAFYKKWYAPNNAVLVISGDTTLEEVLPLANSTYGQLKREDVPIRARTASPKMDGTVRVTYARPDIREPQWIRMLRVPSVRQDTKSSLSLSLLEDLLGGNTGRLYQDLVVSQKLASNVDAAYSGYAWDDATFTLYATPASGVSLEKLEKAVTEALAKIAAHGFTDDEIKKAVGRMQDSAVYARDSLAGPAMNVGYGIVTGLTLDDIETWPKQLEALSKDDVSGALKKFVISEAGVTGWLLPEEKKR